jgi:hypothetical protein
VANALSSERTFVSNAPKTVTPLDIAKGGCFIAKGGQV